MWQLGSLGLASFATCAVMILLARNIYQLTGSNENLSAVQAAHHRPTARVGGVGIFIAVVLSSAFAPDVVASDYLHFLLATSFLFFVGLGEDLGVGIAPVKRLLAAFFASLMVIVLLDVWLPRSNVPGLDPWLEYWWVGVPITLIITAGIANGFNLIDGVNGLAAITAMIASIAMASIAYQAEYYAMVTLNSMLTVIILGFFVLNFPFGKIFLGDAGAYTIGFILSWFGIAMILNTSDVTTWAMLLIMFWPVMDTCLAIYRRLRRTHRATAPDRLHVHQLIMRFLEIYLLGRGRRHIANPLSTLLLTPFIALPACIGVLLWDQPGVAFLAVVALTIFFFTAYVFAIPISRRLNRKRCCV